MTRQFTILFAMFTLLLLLAVMPASAAALYPNGTVINQGATIFIGEAGLNVTHAMNQAYYGATLEGGDPSGVGLPWENNSQLHLTAIGWWASAADLYTTSPSRSIDLGVNRRFAAMTVAPSDFVGYTGNWYLLNASGARPIGNTQDAAMVFNVQDPSLDLKIWDYNQNTDVTGKSVPQGEKLGFRIDTNMYPAVDSRYRSNVIDDSITGTWDIVPIYYEGGNALIDTTGTWVNGTVTIPDPAMPCCREITLYNMAYTNYTSTGYWMTWSDGHYGCDLRRSNTMYWNTSIQNFTLVNSLNGTAMSATDLVFTGTGYCDQWYPVKATDGYIKIKIRDESNTVITKLYNNSVADVALKPGPNSVWAQFVDNQPWFWGTGTSNPVHLNADNQPYDGYVWHTGALDDFNQYAYPVGTYTVWASSGLNKIGDNYKQGGADYTGKTLSQKYTITLVSDSVKIEANKDSVVRSKTFSVTVTGRPSTYYYLWVKGTGSMLGGYDDQSPLMVLNQEGVYMDSNPW
ncbi:MAG: DUF3821 domain-containing protein, partial [Methanoregula sp.]